MKLWEIYKKIKWWYKKPEFQYLPGLVSNERFEENMQYINSYFIMDIRNGLTSNLKEDKIIGGY